MSKISTSEEQELSSKYPRLNTNRNSKDKTDSKSLLAYLGLGVGSEPLASSVASEVGHSLVKLVGEDDGEGHSFLGLIRSVAEHKSLISGTGLVLLTANVDAWREGNEMRGLR